MDRRQIQEARRLDLQARLDGAKKSGERNKLGQFATSMALAQDILTYASSLMPRDRSVRFLDPAFGTGAFFGALLNVFPQNRVISALGFEIDQHYEAPTRQLWQDSTLDLRLGDFTRASPPLLDVEKANLIICNPPYIRHHHVSADEKTRLQFAAKRTTGAVVSKLAGLYCYFLLLAHGWLAKDGISGWLIPSEFMDVNYGRPIKDYLLRKVTLLRIHRFEPQDTQFADALVSSAIVWFQNTPPPQDYMVELTYGGRLAKPHLSMRIAASALQTSTKWTSFALNGRRDRPSEKGPTLADLFIIKRGLATGGNKFFILTPEQIARYMLPQEFLLPILPGSRYLPGDIVHADSAGRPTGVRELYLLSCSMPESHVRGQYPSLWHYLQMGKEAGIHESYLCRHRTPWYSQEQRPSAPFLCTYMGRQGIENANPFRFILNYSKATAANTYHLMYPKPVYDRVLARYPERLRAVWDAFQTITPAEMMGEGRVYGGGLHKVEPRELARISALHLLAVLESFEADDVATHSFARSPVQLTLL
jgi:hypothetical protein